MNLTIHWTFLPHTDADASLAFYRDVLGFEVRNDVGANRMRWITVGPPDQPGTSIVLTPPEAADLTDDERKVLEQMIAKGGYMLVFAADDLDKTFEQVRAAGADVVQELEDHPYGVRDCAFRDPAGNIVRIQQRD
ncbi:glyoxalase [Kribbella sp. ALI-6-A]|uniref:VOC family protein n=1 Tax=Kribbella sp. ALI-6-A TaxID=1933817 RepID=UPI00097C731C|nr:VOC family protein [Kribbella sp. ALI-6-A]ONI69293.1 glyoxalase [Kribbella sp. ALI-6-A]